MERIVYVLGAGFSAPLGVPVVRDFLTRAKDLYFRDPQQLSHFHDVLQAIRGLASVKNYLHADLFDLEEVFSIIEMQRQLGLTVPTFAKFIAHVIKASTPDFPPPPNGSTRVTSLLGGQSKWRGYGEFAMALTRIAEPEHTGGRFTCDLVDNGVQYDVISLNYDRAIETPLDRLASASQSLSPGIYHRPSKGTVPASNCRMSLMKLHGDAEDETIVPPTWNKAVRPEIERDWRRAYEVLSKANHVRILGYSFPETDAYFRYFLKASLAETEHLKTIDVLTLDPEGTTLGRCQKMLAFKFARFKSAAMEGYLQRLGNGQALEEAHSVMMG